MWGRRLTEVKGRISKLMGNICIQKQDFYRELNPLDRIYDVFHTTLFCFVAQNGTNIFFLIPIIIQQKGVYFVVFLLIYGIIALLSATCYAEMAELMPSTGAAYHYCYYSMGELIAFLSGWNMIYSNVLSTYSRCSLIRFLVDDALLNNWIENNMGIIPEYNLFNIFSFGGTIDIVYPVIILTVAAMSTVFVKKGKYICSGFALAYLGAMGFYVFLLLFYADKKNLVAKKREGVRSYAASSFVQASYVFSGYEVISILGEETINPTDTIPRSILYSMKVTIFLSAIWGTEIALAWSGLSLDTYWPFRAMMKTFNLGGVEWISFFGLFAGTLATIFSSFFLLIRLVYAMSRDGLIFDIFSKIDRTTTTPFVPALIVAVCLIILEIFVKQTGSILHSIFISLMATKIVIYICLLYTRYEYKMDDDFYFDHDYGDRWVLINWPRRKNYPTPVTHRLSMKLILILTLTSYVFVQSMITMRIHDIYNPVGKSMAFFSLIIFFLAFVFLSRQPQNDRSGLKHKVPDVPFIPLAAMLSDFVICLNETMRPFRWIPLLLWWLAGIIFYFLFSIKHSVERRMLNPDGTKWEIMNKELEPFAHLYRQDSIVAETEELNSKSEESIITEDLTTSDIEDGNVEMNVDPERSSTEDDVKILPKENESSNTNDVDNEQDNQTGTGQENERIPLQGDVPDNGPEKLNSESHDKT